MRIPISWLKEFVEIPNGTTVEEISAIYTRLGFEEEEIIRYGEDLQGPVVVGKVLEIVEEPQANGKTIRWCQVEVGDGKVHGIVCGASNFFVGDKVVVSLPGASLPGGFEIAARKTYGHVSDGMICSARELKFSDDHNGIIRLIELGLDPALGTDAIELLQLKEEVLDISVLPDRGYAMSMRGVARELAYATGWKWNDPADIKHPIKSDKTAVTAAIEDESAASRIVLRTLHDFVPNSKSPLWMQRRITLAGMRSISLAVDITNYVMLELGQPLHAFDAAKLKGGIKVRRAGEKVILKTLDEVERKLDSRDIVIADESGAIALAGTMGGATTEISDSTTSIAIEAACFSAGDVARTSRAHKLSSEASRRFERGIDHELAPIASARAVDLLCEFGGAKEFGAVEVDIRKPNHKISVAIDFAAKRVGVDYTKAEVVSSLESVGCTVKSVADKLEVSIPSWRPDLQTPEDLSEEVARINGYDRIPAIVPQAVAGNGLTDLQRLRRSVARMLSENGLVEVLSYPFMSIADLDAMRIPAADGRRVAKELLNPLSAEQPLMRTTILAPLLSTARRNVGRGLPNVAIYELGLIVLPTDGPKAEILSVENRPADVQLESLNEAVPVQPWYVGGVLCGNREIGQPLMSPIDKWDWQKTISLALDVVQLNSATASVLQTDQAPWHPGRCAAIVMGNNIVGFAGELHPRVVEEFGLPARSCAFELDVEAISYLNQEVVTATRVKTFPLAKIDLAFVIDQKMPISVVKRAIELAGIDELDAVDLFDVYQGEQVPAGSKSVAFSLTFRALDRTLTDAEIADLRTRAISATEPLGATLR
jgi:phenylalanyl-tRNA synthetase beta chain